MGTSPPVFLFSIDSLRHDFFTQEIFSECWPTIQDKFIRFSNAYSHGVATPFAFPHLLSGQRPTNDGTLKQNTTTLAELFNGKSIAHVNNGQLHRGRGYNRGFDSFVREWSGDRNGSFIGSLASNVRSVAGKIVHKSKVARGAHKRFSGIIPRSNEVTIPYDNASTIGDWLETHLESELPKFTWAHFMDPHHPWNTTGRVEIDLNIPNIQLKELHDDFFNNNASQEEVTLLRQIYKENIKFLDRELAKILKMLKKNNVFDCSLIVIVSDHGEAFGEHGYCSHEWDADPIDELIRIPLAIKYPNEPHAGEIRRYLVSHADIYETISRFLDNRGNICKRSPLLFDDSRTIISRSNYAIRGISDQGWIIRRRDGSSSEYGEVGDRLRSLVKSEPFPEIPKSTGEIPGVPETEQNRIKKQLEALGYK